MEGEGRVYSCIWHRFNSRWKDPICLFISNSQRVPPLASSFDRSTGVMKCENNSRQGQPYRQLSGLKVLFLTFHIQPRESGAFLTSFVNGLAKEIKHYLTCYNRTAIE